MAASQVLLVILKKARVAYSPELGLAPLLAPLLLLATRHFATADGMLDCHSLARHRSDNLNALSALLAKLQPALLAGAPWGLAATGAPSTPPNEALLAQLHLLVQWSSPPLASHLFSSAAGTSHALGRLLLSFLGTVAAPAALVRLVELALLDTPASPRAHPAFVLAALLLRDEAAMLAVPAASLVAALDHKLHVASALEADRLHASAAVYLLASSNPSPLPQPLHERHQHLDCSRPLSPFLD